MQTLKVPLIGTNVIPEGGNGAADTQPPPAPPPHQQPPQRRSLHQVRMPRPNTPPTEYRHEWTDNGKVKWYPVEASAPEHEAPDAEGGAADVETPNGGDNATQGGGFDVPPHPDAQTVPPTTALDGLNQQIQALTNNVNLLMQAQLQGMQSQQPKPQAPQPPDPTQFDFYEPAQVAEFQKLNNAYMQAEIQRTVQSALAPHGESLRDVQYIVQHNDLVARYGDNPNFKAIEHKAIAIVANAPNKFSLTEAYELVASSQLSSSPQQPTATTSQPVAKPAPRQLTAQEAAQKAAQANTLPPRNGVNGSGEPGLPANINNVGALGRIMLHNQQTGRARPI